MLTICLRILVIAIFLVNVKLLKGQNLILNPGNEMPMVNGEIPNWTEVVGTNWTQGASQGAFEGNYYFYVGGNWPADAELRQDIDVSSLACSIDNGLQDFSFAGYVKSYNQTPADLSQIIIEYRNSTNTSVLYTYDSGTNSNSSSWKKISNTTTAPKGTRWIRIRLISTYQNGSGSNDGIYDSLFLEPVPVVVPSPFELGNDTTLCSGNSFTLDASVNGASYLWSTNSTSSTLSISSTGTYWVEVTANSCTFSDTIAITINPTPTLSLGNDTNLCQGQTLTFNLANTGSTTYLWSDNSTQSSFTVSASGSYWVNVTEWGCSASDSIAISYTALPIINLGKDTSLCENEILVLDASTTNASYKWQDNSVNATYTVSNANKYWVEVSVNNCSSSDTINVNYTPLPQVNLGNDSTLCETSSIILNTSISNATYLWSDNSTQASLSPTVSGNYWVIVSVSNCSDTDSVSITYVPQPILSIGKDTSICENSTLLLNATTANANSYLWSDNSTAATLLANSASTYWVKVAVDPCVVYDSIQISEIALPTINLGNDTTICESSTLTLDVTTAGASYLWSTNSTSPVLTVSSIGAYEVNVTTLCGTVSDEINVNTISCECLVYVPNSFSPNDDHLNDEFMPSYKCNFVEYEFSIFNRFGEIVFTTTDEAQAWDGKVNGNLAEVGIYTWHLNYKGDALPRKIMKSEYGRVQLLH